MSRLDELIAELCPDGVEYKKLKEITSVLRGKRLTKSQLLSNGEYPVFHGGIDPLGFYSNYNRDADSVMIINVGASAGTVGYSGNRFWSSDGCFCIARTTALDNRFLYHFLKNNEDYLISHVRVAGIPTLDSRVLEQLYVPVPPLPVQQEIVHILDHFTELTAELQKQLDAELTARKKQYEYYRSLILDNSGGDEKSLGEVCKFIRGPFGGSLKKECFQNDGYAVYEQQHAIYGSLEFRYFISAEKYNELQRFEVKPGDLIVSCSGTIGKVLIIPPDAPRGIINQALLKLTPCDELDAKYLQYCFENTIANRLQDSARGGAIQNVPSVSELKAIKMMLPSIEQQKKVVLQLDYYSKLCNDLTSGLPAEIAARQKQYEYYRDKLLTFKELKKS